MDIFATMTLINVILLFVNYKLLVAQISAWMRRPSRSEPA
jgi:hypothetical protein